MLTLRCRQMGVSTTGKVDELTERAAPKTLLLAMRLETLKVPSSSFKMSALEAVLRLCEDIRRCSGDGLKRQVVLFDLQDAAVAL